MKRHKKGNIIAHYKPGFRAALQSDGTLEILIYEDIGEDFWSGGGITAKTVKQQLDAAGNYSKILVRINSPGGDAFEGIAIYNILDQQKKPVEVRVDGLAASAASIIAMAGDEIIMGSNALMMIHNAWGWCMGYASDMRKMGDSLEKISTAIAQTYVGQTGKTAEEIAALMDAETWLTAQECIDQGFATSIATEPEVEENALAMARKFKALARMGKVPETLKAEADEVKPVNEEGVECACDCQNCLDGNCEDCTNSSCEDSNCEDCPMQENAAAKLNAQPVAPPVIEEPNLSLYEARAKMLLRP